MQHCKQFMIEICNKFMNHYEASLHYMTLEELFPYKQHKDFKFLRRMVCIAKVNNIAYLIYAVIRFNLNVFSSITDYEIEGGIN